MAKTDYVAFEFIRDVGRAAIGKPGDIAEYLGQKDDWNALVFDTYSPQQVQQAVADPSWQTFRRHLWDIDLHQKYLALERWLGESDFSTQAMIQVTNYVNALKRGGLIK